MLQKKDKNLKNDDLGLIFISFFIVDIFLLSAKSVFSEEKKLKNRRQVILRA